MEEFPRGGLPPIQFLETDATTIADQIIAAYEGIAGRTLAPADPVRMFLLSLAAMITQTNNAVSRAFLMNFLSYAVGPFLDALGRLMGVERQPASFATTTVRFTLSAVQGAPLIIPTGTQVSVGQRVFATTEPLVIDAGDLLGDVTARAVVAGPAMNGISVGEVKTIVNPIPFVQSAANLTETSGGAAEEVDSVYAERIRLAPDSFSTAGPEAAYIYWTRSASPAIEDVVIDTPSGGYVDVYIILQGGVVPGPSDPILDEVSAVLSAVKVRPIGDFVTVKPPAIVTTTVGVRWWLRTADIARVGQIDAAVAAAVQDYVAWQTRVIGRDIVPDEIVTRALAAGAKRVIIDNPSFTVVGPTSIAQIDAGDITITYEGSEDD